MVDQVTRADRRFAALREQARVHGITGTVGYLEDAAPAASIRDADVDYFFAQFALLPLVLDANLSGAQWAVGNFRAPLLPNSIPATWRVVEDFGSGVLLLRRSEP